MAIVILSNYTVHVHVPIVSSAFNTDSFKLLSLASILKVGTQE